MSRISLLNIGFVIGLWTAVGIWVLMDRTTPMAYSDGQVLMQLMDNNYAATVEARADLKDALSDEKVSRYEFRTIFRKVANSLFIKGGPC